MKCKQCMSVLASVLLRKETLPHDSMPFFVVLSDSLF